MTRDILLFSLGKNIVSTSGFKKMKIDKLQTRLPTTAQICGRYIFLCTFLKVKNNKNHKKFHIKILAYNDL